MADTTLQGRVRKRAPNACTRCKRQKIRCSGNVPCEQCSKRNLACVFDPGQQKVRVSRDFIANLERRAAHGSPGYDESYLGATVADGRDFGQTHNMRTRSQFDRQDHPVSSVVSEDDATDVHQLSDAEDADPNATRTAADASLVNPLAPGNTPAYTMNRRGKPSWLGATSNWSFGRRVLSMVHEKVHNAPLPINSLLFEGSTYDLGWNGRRTAGGEHIALPTPDYALFLINAVKFQCGQLFHLFDERTFMDQFNKFHEGDRNPDDCYILWYIHYLLILAFGKAFVVRTDNGRCPPGGDFFVQAMKLLPDITFLCSDVLQSIEILCCAALYLQCLDSRSAAYNIIGQAMRISLEQGMHTDMDWQYLDEDVVERAREAWCTVYILDRMMSSLLGAPLTLADEDITARMPSFGGSKRKALALSILTKISKATAEIQRTIYRKDTARDPQFLSRVKDALKSVAGANDDRNESFPLDLKNSAHGISRLSAYLHIFHHQCIILATRPLLFSFWQKRLNSTSSLRIASSGGARSLLRVCVGSAKQTIDILEALQSQSLLESFLCFDLDAAFSSAVVLLLATAVDQSLLRSADGSWLRTIYCLLDEMVSRGNLIAKFHSTELRQLEENLEILASRSSATTVGSQTSSIANIQQNPSADLDLQFHISPDFLSEWNSEDGLSGDQLMALANSLNFDHFDWVGSMEADFTQPFDPNAAF